MEERRNSITISGVLVGLIIGIVLLSGIYVFINKDSIFGSVENNSNNINGNVNSNSQITSIKEDDTKEYVYDANYNYHFEYDKFLVDSNEGTHRVTNDVFNSINIDSGYQKAENLKVPYINIKGFQSINNIIKKMYYDYAETFDGSARSSDLHPVKQVLTYYTYISNDVLSIIIAYGKTQTTPYRIQYLIFNCDLKTGKLLSNDELVQKLKITNLDDQVKEKIKNYIENDWLSDSRNPRTLNFGDGEIDIVEYNVNDYINNSKDRLMYVDSDGNLNVIVFLELGGETQLRKSFVVSK